MPERITAIQLTLVMTESDDEGRVVQQKAVPGPSRPPIVVFEAGIPKEVMDFLMVQVGKLPSNS